MALAAYGWKTTAPTAPPVPPLARALGNRRHLPGSCPAAAGLLRDRRGDLESLVEPYPVDGINRTFEAARRRTIGRRAALVS